MTAPAADADQWVSELPVADIPVLGVQTDA